jgi:hypothetical protein
MDLRIDLSSCRRERLHRVSPHLYNARTLSLGLFDMKASRFPPELTLINLYDVFIFEQPLGPKAI